MRNWKKRTGRWSHQRGAGTVAWLSGAVVVIIIITLGLRLGPYYMDFRTLQAVMNGLPADDVHQMSNRSLRELLQKRFKINNIRNMTVREIIIFNRTKKLTEININYEVREHMLFNIDAVLTFDESYSYR